MTVQQAVTFYVAKRRAEGCAFNSAACILGVLSRTCGDTDLRSLSSDRLSLFVNGADVTQATMLSKYSAVYCFVAYWSLRGAMPSISFQKPMPRGILPAPYIYTAQQVRSLLRGAAICQKDCKKMSGETLYAILITIYATGATIDEVLTLKLSGFDRKRSRLAFTGSSNRAGRAIPIGADLFSRLKQYVRSTHTRGGADHFLFRGRLNDELDRKYVYSRFHRLCRLLQLPDKADGRSPRMLDLRYTFAVHRLTHWIRQNDDLKELLPALSMYMGYATLTKAEEFLAFAPDRFKADLQKLSPQRGRKHWRNDIKLLVSLSAL